MCIYIYIHKSLRFSLDAYTSHTKNVIMRVNVSAVAVGHSGTYTCKASNTDTNQEIETSSFESAVDCCK